MKKDLKVLIETLEAHPDPYTKISEADFQKVVKEVEGKIVGDLDIIENYKNISKLVALIGDGHSSVLMPRYWLDKVRKEHGVFPYEVFLSNEGKLFVVKSYGDEQMPLGAQILAINGKSVDSFIEMVTPYLSYETDAFRNDLISESFEFLLYVVFKQVDQLNFKLETSEVQVASMPYEKWKVQKKDLREEREKKISLGKPYDFNILEPGIAKIDVFSFGITDYDNYRLFLLKTFKKVKKENIHSLIIDIRGNYGGWPKVASELFHYIHDGYFKTMAKSRMKISYPYRSYYSDMYPGIEFHNFTSQKRRHFVDVKKVVTGEIDTYVEESAFFNEPPIVEEYEFSGDCYVLIDRKSYSASSSFASTFQCYNMGVLIGEPTGGTKVFRANPMFKSLPKTGLGIVMSTTKFFTACYNEDNEPVQPNLEVLPSISDRVDGVDVQLNTTLKLIKEVQEKK